MERSLSVLLPVRNVQATLAAAVPEILEVVSQWTTRFELLIIDDGSTDATSEVAQELTRCYPQIRFVSHGSPRGREAAIHEGLQQSSGEITLVYHVGHQPGYQMIKCPRAEQTRIRSRPTRPNYLARLKEVAAAGTAAPSLAAATDENDQRPSTDDQQGNSSGVVGR